MEWIKVRTAGTAPIVNVYECIKPKAGKYTLVTYTYHDGKQWRDFPPGVRLITPRGKEFEGREAVERELRRRGLPEFF